MSVNQEYTLKPAIVLSSHTMGLAVIRALGVMGVPIVVVVYEEKEDMGCTSKYVREKIPALHPEKFEDQFIDVLVKCAGRLGGSLVIPTTDETLAAVSRHKTVLERHYLVACTEWNITEQFIDKKCTYSLADAIGVPAPKTTVPHSAEDVERYSRAIQYPCLVKPCQSHSYYHRFKRKMTRVENLEQMLVAYQEATDAGLEIMLQELIPGDDTQGVNYNSYFWNGEPLIEFTAEKVRNAPAGLGSPRVAVSKHIPEVLEPGRKILQAMGFYGFSCTEFKRDERDGIYKLMEVNGRHNLSGLLAVHCGINFPWMHYKHLVCGELPSACDYQTGVYWIDIIRDIGYSLRCFSKERYSLSQYIQPYHSPHIFAILDMRDPKPFMQRCINLAKRAL
jgi:predicted ATP-grasp superfamily ATP-dependent carboligase